MPQSDVVIETHGLSKQFDGVNALNSLNLQVNKNSIFGFLGPNGAGKTTTIKLLLGLARPTAGSATIFGCDIQRNSTEIRRRVGYLAQDPRYYEHFTARETLRFVARFFYKGPKPEIEERIEETLQLVGLADKADRPLKGFSGGERQRLGIAQAQINYPDLLILDEPAASLDPQGRHDVLEVMERLRKHTTIFYSTHILSDVQRVSDTVAILNRGKLIAQAPIQDLLASGNKGIIYTVTLKGSCPEIEQAVRSQPWVTGLSISPRAEIAQWEVSVTDEATAAAELPRLILAGQGVVITEFGRKHYDLEEVFLSMVEGTEACPLRLHRLQPVQEHGWRMGFANLFRKENSEWWRSRRWWRQAIVWLLIVNGILAAGLWTHPISLTGDTAESTQAQTVVTEPKDVLGLQTFFLVGGIIAALGVTIMAQGSIMDEKKFGTLEWILSKPVSRPAFFLSKWLASSIIVLVIMVALQGLVAYIQISAAKQALLPVLPFIGAVLLMGLYILFFLTLTLMLGVIFDSRGAVIGIPLLLNLGYQFFVGFGLVEILPYRLIYPTSLNDPALAFLLADQQPLPTIMPIISTIVWIALFVAVALWRFERTEF